MGIERITITIKDETLREIDKMIDGRDIRNRSHAIENLINQSLGRLDTVLILAGGNKNKTVPKALMEIHGKTILEHQINMLKQYKIKNFIISTDSEKIREQFGSGEDFDINIEYIIEEKTQGNIWPLHAMRDRSIFAVMNVDTLMNPDITEIFEFHKNTKAVSTMLLVTTEDTSKSGVAVMRGNKIIDFIEKPNSAESKLINAGFYIFSPAVLSFLPARGSIENTLFPRLAREGLLSGYVHDGQVFDIAKDFNKAVSLWKDIK